MRDAAWKDWYFAQHMHACRAHGDKFETYVTSALELFHPGFINPDPVGSLGDGGADGLADNGSTLYASYGQRAIHDAERKLADKMAGDFIRALTQWDSFTRWRFITNSDFGPIASAKFLEFQKAHAPGSKRPISLEVWKPERLWREVVSQLDDSDLDVLLPGVPRAENVDLADLTPLIELLLAGDVGDQPDQVVKPVPFGKMTFNGLEGPTRQEFNEGRLLAARIDRWFEGSSDPRARDAAAARFRRIYEQIAEVTAESRERVERVYTAVGGSDFRHDSRRANATYAITVYFFDSCDIFEEPPADYVEVPIAVAN